MLCPSGPPGKKVAVFNIKESKIAILGKNGGIIAYLQL
jgi:hypothetical protein